MLLSGSIVSAAPSFPSSQQKTCLTHMTCHSGSAEPPPGCAHVGFVLASWLQASGLVDALSVPQSFKGNIHLSFRPPHSPSSEGSDSHFSLPCSLSEINHLPICIHSLALTLTSVPNHLGPQKAKWALFPALLSSYEILGKVHNSSVPQFAHRWNGVDGNSSYFKSCFKDSSQVKLKMFQLKFTQNSA